MPLVTLTVRESAAPALKSGILDAVHAALVSSGVPPADRFQRVLALNEEDFRFDLRYPDLDTDRTTDFALIDILWSTGRSVKVKRALLAHLMASLTSAGVQTENVMVCFQETTWENWSFSGGRMPHV
jgi:hypothetical protein